MKAKHSKKQTLARFGPSKLMKDGKLTMAEEEAKRRQEEIYKKALESGSIRKSKRLMSFSSQPRIKTHKMRRLHDLFWADDESESDSSSADENVSPNSSSSSSSPSSPSPNSSDSESSGHKKNEELANRYVKVSPRLKLKKIYCNPNIYTIDNFVTEAELNYLQNKIQSANTKKLFKKSFIDDSSNNGTGSASGSTGRKHGRKRQRSSCGKFHENSNGVSCSNGDNCNVGVDKGDTNRNTFTDKNEAENGKINVNFNSDGGDGDSTSVENESVNTNEETPHENDPSKQRTSQFIHFTKQSDSTITTIEQRACELLSLPNENIEPIQLVKYDIGQYFNVHHDLGVLYEDGSVELPQRNNVLLEPPRRIVTILVYLNDVKPCHGGSTQFPLLLKNHESTKLDNEIVVDGEQKQKQEEKGSSPAKDLHHPTNQCLEILPKRGMALVWCNITRDGLPDTRVVHSGQPLLAPSSRSSSRNSNDHDENDQKDSVVKYAMNIWACEY